MYRRLHRLGLGYVVTLCLTDVLHVFSGQPLLHVNGEFNHDKFCSGLYVISSVSIGRLCGVWGLMA